MLTIPYILFSNKISYIPFNGFYYRVNPNVVIFSAVTLNKLTQILESENQVCQILCKLLENNNIHISKLDKVKQELGKNFISMFYRCKNHEEWFSQFSDKFMQFLMMKIYRIIKPYENDMKVVILAGGLGIRLSE